MSYIGKKVKHSIYGEGTIIRDGGDKIFAEFPENEKYAENQYCFNVPEAFQKGHLELLRGEVLNVQQSKTNLQSSNKYRDLYKKPFWDYLNEDKIKRTGTPYKMDTVAVDAFYLEKHSPNHDFIEWLRSDESMEAAREELARLLEEAGGDRVKVRIDGYFSALSKLRDYLIQRGEI